MIKYLRVPDEIIHKVKEKEEYHTRKREERERGEGGYSNRGGKKPLWDGWFIVLS